MFFKNKKKIINNKAFTLIEMLVSISLFTIVVTIAFSALHNIMDANTRSKSVTTVVSNLNMVMESMTREIRMGHNYTCGMISPQSGGIDCTNGKTSFAFVDEDKNRVSYRRDGNRIERRTEIYLGGGNYSSAKYVTMTGENIDVSHLKFHVLGAGTGNAQQARVLITLKASVRDINDTVDFNIQTTVSQRKIDR